MGKGKDPRKRKHVAPSEPVDEAKEPGRQTQEKSELVPPSRRPPTVRQPQPSGLSEFVDALRIVVGRLLDLADAAADAITTAIERRA